MTRIRLNTQQAREVAQRLCAEADALDRMTNSLNHAIGSLDTWAWDGRSRARAESRLNRVAPAGRDAAQLLEDLGRKLRHVADTFEREDTTASRNLDGMSWVEWEADGSILGIVAGVVFFGLITYFVTESNKVYDPLPMGKHVIGNSNLEKHYKPQRGNTCGFQATQNILKAFGKTPTIEELKASAGYAPEYEEGTFYKDYETMFSANGIAVDGHESFETEKLAVDSLLKDLKDGKAILARIDVGPLDTYWGNQSGGHAIWITSVRVNDKGEITHFVCNDSGLHSDNYQNGTWEQTNMVPGSDGIPDGQGIAYPVHEFLDAWEEREYSYIATKDPIPN